MTTSARLEARPLTNLKGTEMPESIPDPKRKAAYVDPASVHAAAFEARVQAAIQASVWALKEAQLPLVGHHLQHGKGAPMDALGRKGSTLLVVEAKAFYTAVGGRPSSVDNRQAALRHGLVQLDRAAKVLARETKLAFGRSLPAPPRKVWGALVSEVEVPGLGLLAGQREDYLFVGAYSLNAFSAWLKS